MLNTSKTPDQAITPSLHFNEVTPGSAQLATLPKGLLILTDGDLSVESGDAVVVTWPVVAGQVIPIRPYKVLAATTARVLALA